MPALGRRFCPTPGAAGPGRGSGCCAGIAMAAGRSEVFSASFRIEGSAPRRWAGWGAFLAAPQHPCRRTRRRSVAGEGRAQWSAELGRV